jgi:alpha-beta hydrolase superfamily lysophospholipase
LAALRASLPPYQDDVSPSQEMLELRQFYGIDFEQTAPQIQYRVGSVKSGAFSLAVHSYQQPGASRNLLLVHGYLDHSGLFGHLIEHGLKRHCNVLIFDLPGHGLSTGDPVAIDDFKEYSRAIAAVLAAAKLPSLPWWAMAQSTGCSALMEYSRTANWPFSAAVFLAPLIRPKDWNIVRLAHVLLHRFIDSTKRSFAKNSSDQEFLDFMRQDPLQSRTISVRWVGALRRWLADLPLRDLGIGSVLVLQGDKDGTVAWRRNMKDITVLIPGCQIVYLAGAGHHLANESDDIRSHYLAQIDRFVDDRLPPPLQAGK